MTRLLTNLNFARLLSFPCLFVVLQNRSGRLIDLVLAASGWTSYVKFEISCIGHLIQKTDTVKITIIHNQPQGYAQPTMLDVIISKKWQNEAKKHGLMLVDHLILAEDRFFSLRDSGYLSRSI